jgi:hypothetical protein
MKVEFFFWMEVELSMGDLDRKTAQIIGIEGHEARRSAGHGTALTEL